MASLDDQLTATKNGVIAINSYVSNISIRAGSYSTKEISTSTVVKSTAGWLATVSVIVAGSTQGYIYDTNSTSTTSGNRIYAVPNTIGIYQIQIPFATGLTFVPGTSSVISIGYS